MRRLFHCGKAARAQGSKSQGGEIMVMRRTAAWLIAWVVMLGAAGTAFAQVPANSNLTYQTAQPSYENAGAAFNEANPKSHDSVLPFHQLGVEPTARPFGPAETSSYGNGPRPHVGYFASMERLFWSLSKPKLGFIGSETASAAAFHHRRQFSRPTDSHRVSRWAHRG